jgi:hypothetical protein
MLLDHPSTKIGPLENFPLYGTYTGIFEPLLLLELTAQLG